MLPRLALSLGAVSLLSTMPLDAKEGVSFQTSLRAPSCQVANNAPGLELEGRALSARAEARRIKADLQLAPTTGELEASFELSLSAYNTPLSALIVHLDSGLQIAEARLGGHVVARATHSIQGLNVSAFAFDPPLEAGESKLLELKYGGVLKCDPMTTGKRLCARGDGLGVALEGSILPSFKRLKVSAGDPVERWITVHVPVGQAVVASGTKTLDIVDGLSHTTRWRSRGYHASGPPVLAFGNLKPSLVVNGIPLPTAVYSSVSPSPWRSYVASWVPEVMRFLEKTTELPLPFTKLNVVNLPAQWTLARVASPGLVLISEAHSGAGLEHFEEVLAHELSHEWWGVAVSPRDGHLTRWLTEGLATVSQLDYAAARFRGARGQAEYLRWRFREHTQVLRYGADVDLPPLVLHSPHQIPKDSEQEAIWATLKSSATLAYIRSWVGDSAFLGALRRYAKECAGLSCTSADFQQILEDSTGLRLDAIFEHWVYGSTYPKPVIDFSQKRLADGRYQISIKAKGAEHNIPMQMIIGDVDGQQVKRRVVLHNRSPAVVTVERPAWFVRPDPLQDAVVPARSATNGDVTFDQEIDGFDVIACAHSFGRHAGSQTGLGRGMWDRDLDFNFRCDSNGDGRVGDVDFRAQTENFGSLRR